MSATSHVQHIEHSSAGKKLNSSFELAFRNEQADHDVAQKQTDFLKRTDEVFSAVKA